MRVPLPSLMTSFRGRDLDPFEGFRRGFDDLLRDFGRQWPMTWPGGEAMNLPALDIAETKDAVEISAELPGVTENEVNVTLEGQSVVISGEKKSEKETKEKSWQVVERSYGSFRRVVPLDFAPDAAKMTATFDNGVLHVKIGKPEEQQVKKLTVPISKASQA